MTIAIIVFIAAALFFAFRARNSAVIDDPHAPSVPASNEGVLLLIRQQKTIEAIKLYREIHNAGLKEAKDAVDAMAKTGKAVPVSPDNSVDDADVVSMIRSGNTIDAIRMYRELHGTDLKTAKDAVDALAQKLGP